MNKKEKAIDNFFSHNLIDLSLKADRESKDFTSKLIWENLALKIAIKLRSLIDITFSYSIKSRIQSKLRHQKALSPNDFLIYRSQYWEKIGQRNYKKIVQAINQRNVFGKSQSTKADTNLFPKLFLEELFELRKQGRLTILEATYDQDCTSSKNEAYFFFDSYYFFNGGHIANIEQTVDNLQSSNCDAIYVFLIDKNMVLFPQLSKLILKKCRKRIVFDCTNNPIRLTINSRNSISISQLAANYSINLSHSIITTDCIFNPCITWKYYPYAPKNQCQKAWPRAFQKGESINIVNGTLNRLSFSTINSNYVVIHARNATLMSDNIRNTKPLFDRANLFSGIFKMGLQVIVLGVMEPSSKFKHPGVIYADEMGPISDDLQVHILNGAIGIIGSPSGVTCLAYCTDTPLLLVDIPFPFCSCYPASNMKALLKKLKLNNNNISLSKYYMVGEDKYLEDVRDNKAYSPLYEEKIELECNSDQAIIHAFQELLLNTYSPIELRNLKLKIEQSDCDIDTDAATRDVVKINNKLQRCKKSSNRYPLIETDCLSTANWYRD